MKYADENESRYNEEFSKYVRDLASSLPGIQSILEIGCGTGIDLRLFPDSFRLHGIDLNEHALEIAKERLNQVIMSMVGTRIITQIGDYWHVEFTTRWLRFIDDVEFYFPESEALVHLRSASRNGYWDLGVNRKRVEGIRSRFEELASLN